MKIQDSDKIVGYYVDLGCSKNAKSPTKVQQIFLQWYIIIHHNAITVTRRFTLHISDDIKAMAANWFCLEADERLCHFLMSSA